MVLYEMTDTVTSVIHLMSRGFGHNLVTWSDLRFAIRVDMV